MNIGQQAIEKWGPEKQTLTLVEEMAELTQAIIKWIARTEFTDVPDNIIEEVIDVEIMLEQFHLILAQKSQSYALDYGLKKSLKLEKLERKLQS